jgi:hypothetical protein
MTNELSNEEAIKMLKSKMDGHIDTSYKWAETVRLAIQALESQRWIPCSERLPEEADVYLVSMNRLGYPQREVDGFVCGRWERFGNDVIAWCKIPEPYKEESEDEE